MQKNKSLNDTCIQRKSLSKETTVYFKLHVITSQIERLSHSKEELLNKLAQIDSKIDSLKYQYNLTKKDIECIEAKNTMGSKQ